ncbi:MAG: radical SAM protein [Candidatus Gracilibacteria bacterium]|nr:radical SAM protein [Candidatus Gracilibacteria bacterium]
MGTVFYYKDIIKIDDSLLGFDEILKNSCYKKYNIFFEFKNIEKSFSLVKKIILDNYKNINFQNLYFYNANDFINFIIKKPIYLPNNINLFINEGCFIGCVYCDNVNDSFNMLSLESIKFFLSKYNLGDNINYNIIGQGDPLFHPELFKILDYIKSIGGHITFFSGGKSLLYCSDINRLNILVDEFKINISASNHEVYNLTHSNKINKDDFDILISKFKIISKKTTFITVINKFNINDLYNLYNLIISIGAFGFEIKKNVFYRNNDILNNKEIYNNIIKLIVYFSRNKNINIVTNIISGFIKYNIFPEFLNRQKNLLDFYIDDLITKKTIEEINNINVCHQFGNSIDIIEKGIVSLCCKYDIGNVSLVDGDGFYYDNDLFISKYSEYSIKTPDGCKKCPMPIDRYKNYLKYNFINDL